MEASPRVVRGFLQLLPAVIALAAAASPAWAGGIVVSTGPAKGSYDYIGERLKTELIVGHGERIELRQSAGSAANLKQLGDPESPVNVALAQADVLSVYLTENASAAERFLPLGDVGKECAFLIGAARDEAATLTALQQRGGKVSVGDDRSGAKITFSSMLRLTPALARLRPAAVPTLEALLQLAGPAVGEPLVAVMVVQRPRRVSPAFEHVLRHPDDFRWIPIRASEVGNDTLPDGSPLYSFETVPVGGVRGGGLTVETLCTRGLMLAAKDKLTPEQRALLSEVMTQAGPRILGRSE